jgi:hypothetical protein
MSAPNARHSWHIWLVVTLFAVACTTTATCFHPPRFKSPSEGFQDIETVAWCFSRTRCKSRPMGWSPASTMAF